MSEDEEANEWTKTSKLDREPYFFHWISNLMLHFTSSHIHQRAKVDTNWNRNLHNLTRSFHDLSLCRMFLFFLGKFWLQNCKSSRKNENDARGKKGWNKSLLFVGWNIVLAVPQCININVSLFVFQLINGKNACTQKIADKWICGLAEEEKKKNRNEYSKREGEEQITIELSHRHEAVLGLVSSAASVVINSNLPCNVPSWIILEGEAPL